MTKSAAVLLAAAVLSLAALAVVVAGWGPWQPLRFGGASDAGSLNISWFVYRDVNRNGVYDLADRPYAGFPIRLERPDGSAIRRDSNINGFANFKMSRDPRKGVIHEPAAHTLAAQVPANWEVTSGASRETLRFAEHDAAPAGLVAERTLTPLGVAPVARIEGQIPDGRDGDALRATGPDGRTRQIRLREDGSFRVTGEPGSWRLELRGEPSERRITRTVEMGYEPRILPPSFFRGGARPEAGSSVLVDYDDLIRTNTVYEIPNGYRGLQWRNWLVTHNLFYEGDGYVNATVSSEFAAYNSSGHPASISREAPFDFEGSYIGVAWPQARRGKVHVEGYRDGELAYHTALRIGPDSPVYLHADYRGITELRIHSDAYWQVILDDSRFRLPEAQVAD